MMKPVQSHVEIVFSFQKPFISHVDKDMRSIYFSSQLLCILKVKYVGNINFDKNCLKTEFLSSIRKLFENQFLAIRENRLQKLRKFRRINFNVDF
jgi:hypothetical protein